MSTTPIPDLQATEDLKALLEKATPPTIWGARGFQVDFSEEPIVKGFPYCAHANAVGSFPIAWFASGLDADAWVAAVNLAPALLTKAHEAEGLAKEVERLTADFANACDVGRRQEARAETAEREAEGLKAEVERLNRVAANGMTTLDLLDGWSAANKRIVTAEARVLQLEAENRALREAAEKAREGLSIAAGWARTKPDSDRARDKIRAGLDAIKAALRPAREGVAS